jgi:curved DNA-binding protein CbpA
MPHARQLPEPLAQGDLARTPFAHVLLYANKHGLEGSFVVWEVPEGDERPRQARILFDHGVPVAARLLERASRLERGLLPMFARTRGPYAFYEAVDLVGSGEGVLTGKVDLLPLVAASLRGSTRDDVVAQVCAAFGAAKLRLARGAPLGALGLLAEERAFVDLLRAEPMSVARLVELSPLPPRMAERIVYLLALTKSVAPWDGAAAAAGASASSVPPPRPIARRASTPAFAAQASAARPKVASAPPAARRRGEPEPVPPAPAGLSAAHRASWDEVAQRAGQIDSETYFDMLGVERDAGPSAVQAAYFGLVKKWHPDRILKELAPLRPHVEAIFRHLTHAQETLCDEAKRGPYLASVQEGGGTPAAERRLAEVVQAAMEFRKVEVLLKRRELDEALRIVEQCLAINDEDADYHAARGWILFQQSAGTPPPDALGSIERALALAPTHDRAFYYKGMVLDRMSRSREATDCFCKAANLNPKNIEAVRMVRLAKIRVDTEGSAGGSKDSLFGKIFGKKS